MTVPVAIAKEIFWWLILRATVLGSREIEFQRDARLRDNGAVSRP